MGEKFVHDFPTFYEKTLWHLDIVSVESLNCTVPQVYHTVPLLPIFSASFHFCWAFHTPSHYLLGQATTPALGVQAGEGRHY